MITISIDQQTAIDAILIIDRLIETVFAGEPESHSESLWKIKTSLVNQLPTKTREFLNRAMEQRLGKIMEQHFFREISGETAVDNVVYLGDGVYVGYDGYQLWLMTGSHDRPDNQIALEPSVFENLIDYLRKNYPEPYVGLLTK